MSITPSQTPLGWPVDLKRLKNPPIWLSSAIIVLALTLSIFLLFVSIVALWKLASDLLSPNASRGSEAVKSLLPIAAAALGLPLIIWRLAILNRQTATAEAKTQIDRDTLYTSLFSRSVDQLGQTREYKESRQNDSGAIETITRTSPNIEVRLGGLHSLVRLSEESTRDSKKIANMLRSYVRENSWYDRDGLRTKINSQPVLPSTSWEFSLHKGTASPQIQEKIDEWKEAFVEEANKRHIWGNSLLETRVDVNEAIDSAVSIKEDGNNRHLFYECLFSRRKFKSSALATAIFERCTFANCEFELPELKRVDFSSCEFLDCVIAGQNSSVSIEKSYLVNFRGRLTGKTYLRIASSKIKSLFLMDIVDPIYVDLSFSYAADVFISGKAQGTPVCLNAIYLAASNLFLSNIKLDSRSDFEKLALIDGTLSAADLSALTNFEPHSIIAFRADKASSPPASFPRPERWTTQDDDNEIPF